MSVPTHLAHVLAPIAPTHEQPDRISITPLLKRLSAPHPQPQRNVPAIDIALAWARTFENRLSGSQLASLLTLLCSTGLDKHPDVIAECAEAMREAAAPIDEKQIQQVLGKRKRARGTYRGGLCDIVGTGGDSHSTFNISTTSSIIAAPLLAMAKHGNRAQTSMSGSADVLKAVTPKAPILENLTAEHLPQAFEDSNYAFLLATNFHPGMKYAATVRKELGLRTIFNLMGPLANPVHNLIEVRMLGVAYQELGPIFAEALRKKGVTKAMVVCGAEDLDEISCAGKTNCWWLKEVPNPKYQEAEDEDESEDEEPKYIPQLETFAIEPADFGFPAHPLSEVGGGKMPKENAKVMMSLLRNEMERDHPILHFVLINVAALLVVSGVCDSDSSELGEVITERGPGGGRWKEGARLARYCLESGRVLQEFEKFIDLTHKLQVS
ncbi:anthranilate phosphoribosyltransferase [Exophiala xenobiotica]|uniref:Anthranilate phosphoribosyltransferase n=1 Tax=Lithohypha guttulata TaxID=1690604 RepID=A0ABR0K9B3_9EURO|nr:anthranilate phosphoribosyltransferase [Lithohypha guttulata]KAK5318031.1 anthranilate phosphoribosyltransferase [Exophiala xenobiotica]